MEELINLYIRGNKVSISDDFDRSILCPQNSKLLNEIEKTCKVYFIIADNYESWVSTFGFNDEGTKVGVVIMSGEYDDCAAGHELLHLKRGLLVDNVAICRILYDAANEDKRLAGVFTQETIDQISNNADHLLIFPEYCAMGLSPDRFFQNNAQQEKHLHELLQQAISSKHPGDVFSALMMILFHPKKDKWSTELRALKKIEPDLYKACNDFSNRIVASISDKDQQSSLEKAYKSFVKSIQLWLTKLGIHRTN